jgi:hypothetical protein
MPLSHLLPRVNFFYTPPDAWHGKIYGMARELFFPRHEKIQGKVHKKMFSK